MNKIAKALIFSTVIASWDGLDKINQELEVWNEYFSREARMVLLIWEKNDDNNKDLYAYIRTENTPEGESTFIEPGVKYYDFSSSIWELKLYKKLYTENWKIESDPLTIENKYKFNGDKSEVRANVSLEDWVNLNYVEWRHHLGKSKLFYIQAKYNTDSDPKKNKWYIWVHLFMKKFMW